MVIYFVESLRDEASKNMGEFLESSIDFEKTIIDNEDLSIILDRSKKYSIIKVKRKDIIYTQFIEKYLYDVDFIIFLSKHESKKSIKTLSVHCTGNWLKDSNYGGLGEEISISYPKLQTELLKEIYRNNKFNDFLVSFEVTHHGPTLDYPLVFYEIGSSLSEWRNEKVGEFMVDILINVLEKGIYERKYEKIWFGIGGPHYAPYFTKKVLEDEEDKIAIGHIMPSYVITEELNIRKMVEKGIKKNRNNVNEVIILKKSIKGELRKEVINIVNSMKSFYNYNVNIVK